MFGEPWIPWKTCVGFTVFIPSTARIPPPVTTSSGSQLAVAVLVWPEGIFTELPATDLTCNSLSGPAGPCIP